MSHPMDAASSFKLLWELNLHCTPERAWGKACTHMCKASTGLEGRHRLGGRSTVQRLASWDTDTAWEVQLWLGGLGRLGTHPEPSRTYPHSHTPAAPRFLWARVKAAVPLLAVEALQSPLHPGDGDSRGGV